MKKMLICAIAVLLITALVLPVISCAGQSAPPVQSKSSSTTATSQPTQKILLRIATEVATPISRAVALNYFKQIVDKRLGDKVDCRVFTGGSLYKDAPALDALNTKELEMTWVIGSLMAKIDKRVGISLTPYIGYERPRQDFYSTPSMKSIIQNLETKGLKVIGWGRVSMIGLGAKKSIISPSDFTGMKVRHADPISGAATTALWNGSTVTMSFADVPSSMASGIIDGCLTSVEGWITIKDVAPYYDVFWKPGDQEGVLSFVTSTTWWNSLPQDVKSELQKCVDETVEYQRQLAIKDDAALLKSNGVPGIDPAKTGTGDATKQGIYVLSDTEVEQWARPYFAGLKVLVPIYGNDLVKDIAMFNQGVIKKLGVWDTVKADLGISE